MLYDTLPGKLETEEAGVADGQVVVGGAVSKVLDFETLRKFGCIEWQSLPSPCEPDEHRSFQSIYLFCFHIRGMLMPSI